MTLCGGEPLWLALLIHFNHIVSIVTFFAQTAAAFHWIFLQCPLPSSLLHQMKKLLICQNKCKAKCPFFLSCLSFQIWLEFTWLTVNSTKGSFVFLFVFQSTLETTVKADVSKAETQSVPEKEQPKDTEPKVHAKTIPCMLSDGWLACPPILFACCRLSLDYTFSSAES